MGGTREFNASIRLLHDNGSSMGIPASNSQQRQFRRAPRDTALYTKTPVTMATEDRAYHKAHALHATMHMCHYTL